MLASQNNLNPANGSPITVPSQDMVLGLYYMTKARKSTKEYPVKGEGLVFYSAEEVHIALNDKRVDLNAIIKIRAKDFNEKGKLEYQLIESTVGRVLFNEVVPEEAGYINEVLTKKNLREIIGGILKVTKVLKRLSSWIRSKIWATGLPLKGVVLYWGYYHPSKKEQMIVDANKQVEGIMANYNMGLITITTLQPKIDVWTSTNATLTELAMKNISEDQQGFNSVYMMLILEHEVLRADSSAYGNAGSNGQAKEIKCWRW